MRDTETEMRQRDRGVRDMVCVWRSHAICRLFPPTMWVWGMGLSPCQCAHIPPEPSHQASVALL